ncbi:GTPase Era [Thermosulfuriphilus sp.]
MTETKDFSLEEVIPAGFRSGYVAIIGAPNVGKSTLLNQYLGQKVAICTPKPQTTRHQIRGILSGPDFQIVFVDTPGIHEAKILANQAMVEAALRALEEVDAVLLVVDVANRQPSLEEKIIGFLSRVQKPAVLALNKIDLVKKSELLLMIETFSQAYPFSAIVPISALKGDGLSDLLQELLKLLPEGPPFYDPETFTDQTERQLAAEIIREKIFLLTGQEIPYATAVIIEDWEDDEEKNLSRIRATVFVERDSQKGIVIGKGGRMLKKIGQLAREELEFLLGRRVYLELWVKVLSDWRRDPKALRRLGLA